MTNDDPELIPEDSPRTERGAWVADYRFAYGQMEVWRILHLRDKGLGEAEAAIPEAEWDEIAQIMGWVMTQCRGYRRPVKPAGGSELRPTPTERAAADD